MMQPVYDTIGKTYDMTRKADAAIASKLNALIDARPGAHLLDVGCGSGNYTHAMSEAGCRLTGIDISEEMLGKARIKYPDLEWVLGDARSLPFGNGIFDGAACILASHHIKDIITAFKEIYRVIGRGNFVIFTSFREQMAPYWLNRYFPEMIRLAARMMHSEQEVIGALSDAGFREITATPYFVTNALQDWFLQSGKYRPHIYLDPNVRAGISTFALMKDHAEIETGCARLKADIASGAMENIIADHESPLGDYVFVRGVK